MAYGRLLAYLSARSRDIAGAEDALAGAFQAALETWPLRGVPDSPDAWLLTAARRNLLRGYRRRSVAERATPTVALMLEENAQHEAADIPDERLKLLFICAHPAIDPAARTPLMLQVVLGLDAARIASAFLVAPAAMSQRLVRAKARIRDAGIGFAVPERQELPARLDAVLSAIYAAFGAAWDGSAGGDDGGRGLASEALWLARLLVELLPDEPEAAGLLALMLFINARAGARRSSDGRFVPLGEQDVSLWSADEIAEAESILTKAAAAGRLGRYQLEAAIQSVHCQRALTGRTNWQALEQIYEGLVALAPAVGALVGRAAVRAESKGAGEALAMLDQLPAAAVSAYQPYWAVRGHVLATLSRHAEARASLMTAIGLSSDPAVRAFLIRRMNGPQPSAE